MAARSSLNEHKARRTAFVMGNAGAGDVMTGILAGSAASGRRMPQRYTVRIDAYLS